MIVKAIYYKPWKKAYEGQAYTFRTNLPLHPGDRVLVPGSEADEKPAMITEVDLPESVIDPAWADRVKWITQMDTEVRA